jgi:hypothetical protein
MSTTDLLIKPFGKATESIEWTPFLPLMITISKHFHSHLLRSSGNQHLAEAEHILN